MGKTSIEWTDRSANSIRARHKVTRKVGWHCVKTSHGCTNCYSSVLNGRFGTQMPYTARSEDDVELFFDARPLEALRRLRKPSKVFLYDMTDLFMDSIPDEWIDLTMAYIVLGNLRGHTYQILTKRAERLPRYFNDPDRKRFVAEAVHAIEPMIAKTASLEETMSKFEWPLKNLWLGVSVETQRYADERIPHLLQTPAAVRFLSVEPLLGPVDLRRGVYMKSNPLPWHSEGTSLDGIHWVIVGGESGHGARPMHPDWARFVRDQCVAAGVPFHFKQWGEWSPVGAPVGVRMDWVHVSGLHYGTGESIRGDRSAVESMSRVGKKVAGRMLDGRTWDEFPAAFEVGK